MQTTVRIALPVAVAAGALAVSFGPAHASTAPTPVVGKVTIAASKKASDQYLITIKGTGFSAPVADPTPPGTGIGTNYENDTLWFAETTDRWQMGNSPGNSVGLLAVKANSAKISYAVQVIDDGYAAPAQGDEFAISVDGVHCSGLVKLHGASKVSCTG